MAAKMASKMDAKMAIKSILLKFKVHLRFALLKFTKVGFIVAS